MRWSHALRKQKNRRILVIDDNEAIHEDFHKLLAIDDESLELRQAKSALFGDKSESVQICYEVESAYQGEEGLEKVIAALDAKRPYALAFVDMRMPPGWDGLKTIEHVWQ